MSLDYIRSYYQVPAKRDMRVVADGKPGVIVGAEGQWLRIRIDGEVSPTFWHPTWRVEYLPEPAEAVAS